MQPHCRLVILALDNPCPLAADTFAAIAKYMPQLKQLMANLAPAQAPQTVAATVIKLIAATSNEVCSRVDDLFIRLPKLQELCGYTVVVDTTSLFLYTSPSQQRCDATQGGQVPITPHGMAAHLMNLSSRLQHCQRWWFRSCGGMR